MADLLMNSADHWSQLLPLESPRLVRRRFTKQDVESFLAYRNDPQVSRFQGWECCNLAEATAFVSRQETQKIGKPFKARWADEYVYAVLRSDWLERGRQSLIHGP